MNSLHERTGSNTSIDRLDLIRWIRPMCSATDAALRYPKADGKPGPGWVQGEADVDRAFEAFENGTLRDEVFDSVTLEGVPYTIRGADRIGAVLHRDGCVRVFCVDLDDHTDDGGNVGLERMLARFFDAQPIVFTSKGGKGVHCFYLLKDPMPIHDFVNWCKRWGFNRKDQPEVFPKTDKRLPVWLPAEPNDNGGDSYCSGTFETCVVETLPKEPSEELTNATLSFLRGEITQPGRNDALNKASHELGRMQVDQSNAWILCARASKLCGLEPEETKRTFNSGYNNGLQAPPLQSASSGNHAPSTGPVNRYSLDGIGNSKRFISMFRHDARFCYMLKQWYVWDVTRWTLRQDRIESMAKLAARSIEAEMNAVCGQNTELRKQYERHLRSSGSKRGLEEILFTARSIDGVPIDPAKLDGDPMLFNCRNGTINLRTGDLQKHRRQDMLTKVSPAQYDPDALCPRWLAFLDRVFGSDRDTIDYMQRVAGYALTGDTSEQCLFFMYGLGCNGKSVFASVLLHVMGDYGQRAVADLVMKPGRSSLGNASPDLARLKGARLVVTSELEEDQRFGESQIKNLTGGDRVVGRNLYKGVIEFDPTHKLLLYGNHQPKISGTDHGIWRRMRQIPFEVTIPESERDPYLLDALKSESDGILAWMVEGCLAWQRSGLGLPRSVDDATKSFRGESDQVGRFLQDCCSLGAGVFVRKSELYSAYQQWCGLEGEEPLAKNVLSTRLTQRGIESKPTKAYRLWIGIELREDTDHG